MKKNKFKETIVINEDTKKKKLGFFKKVWYSITKFDKYIDMSLEGVRKALKYLVQITGIFVLIIALTGTHSVNTNLNEFIKNMDENIPDFKYAEGNIALAEGAENRVYTFEDKNLNFGKMIIDLNTEDENAITQYENDIINDEETGNIGFIILKDKVVQVAKLQEGLEGETRVSLTYDEVMQSLFGSTEVEITKSRLLEYLNGNGRTSILVVNFLSYLIAYFIIYICSGLIYALILGLIGYFSSKMLKISLKFSQIFSISIYACTLSNILNIIYFVANYFFGITFKYLDIAYIILAYIYLVAVISLLKIDSTKKQEESLKKEEEEKSKTDGQEQI